MATPDVKFVMGKFAKSLGLPFDDCEVQGGRFWSVSTTEPPAASAARAAVTAAKEGAAVVAAGARGDTRVEATATVGGGVVVADDSAEPLPLPPPPRRRTASSSIDRGFLGDPIGESKPSAGTLEEDGVDDIDDGNVDEDIATEARAFLEGGGAAAAAAAAAARGGAKAYGVAPFSTSPRQPEGPEDDGDAYVDAEDADEVMAEAEAFLRGERGSPDSAPAIAGSTVESSSRQKKEQSPKKTVAGGDADGVSKDSAEPVLETFEVAGGLAIVNAPEGAEDDDDFEGDFVLDGGEFDEDDWGDGDWGDGERAVGEEEDDEQEDEEEAAQG
ncbi:unnamed protein product [Ectocarpus sp. 13 AM-2016]